jgi:hypothetical protein
MINKIGLLLWGLLAASGAKSQELFVFTEPASNMATHSIGLRLNNTLYHMADGSYSYRLEPEIMLGASRKLMVHAAGYFSNMYQPNFRAEGGSIYAKYRFYADDGIHRHFRMAAFAKAALVNQPPGLSASGASSAEGISARSDEIDLNGTNSGYLAGLVGTQLLHKVALSGSLAYTQRWDQGQTAHGVPGQSMEAINYTASFGWLLLPKHYTSYHQTNINLMCEWLASTALDKSEDYVDVAPAIQFIFNSISRLDLGYRAEVLGNMDRWSKSGVFLRLEYNILNAYR